MTEDPFDYEFDFKVTQNPEGGWIVLDPEGNQVAGPFDRPEEAGKWARAVLIKRKGESDARD